MKEKILKLRNSGYSYSQIVEELGCSKSTISYHCNEEVKKKTIKRFKDSKNRSGIKRVNNFTQKVRIASSDFKRYSGQTESFTYKDVISKFGEDTVCYLTGKAINLFADDFNFDHIVPICQGGSGNIDNLGITTKRANMAKSDMTVKEFLELCKEVLEYNGYIVQKEDEPKR